MGGFRKIGDPNVVALIGRILIIRKQGTQYFRKLPCRGTHHETFWAGFGIIVLYRRSPKVGNPIASILKSNV